MIDKINNYKTHIGSAILTIIVASLVLFSGPASAVNVDIQSLAGSHLQGTDIKFKIDVAINQGRINGELLPIQYSNITFTFPNSTKITCKVFNDGTVEGCGFLSAEVKITGNNNFGYGEGFGVDNGTGYPLGFGYGYGDNNKNTHVMYDLEIDSSDLPSGQYSAVANVFAGTSSPHTFSSGATTFKIFGKQPLSTLRQFELDKKENENGKSGK